MRRLLKFLHTAGATGLVGAAAAVLVLINSTSSITSPAGYAVIFGAMLQITTWIFLPSLVVTIIAGLLAIAVNPVFHDAGWAWAKAATGILIFEGGLHILGSIQEEAKRSAQTLANLPSAEHVGQLVSSERNTLWVMLAITVANIALGVWRPRLPRISA